ncbi:MAG: hypothetical protein HYR85_25520 [Planctomycetes bacterium]|nr:hypothetical protein [Planctomycetota bacterium]MBI3845043.1 hypothetical protein [Planctomycetota bacterium]
MRRFRNSVVVTGCLSALAIPLATFTGCGGGGGGGGSSGVSNGGPLELVAFEQDERTDVSRNQPLTFTFSTSIDPQSVSVDGFQIRSGLDVVQGRVVVNGNQLTFYPTVLLDDRNDYNPPNDPPINGVGLLASTQYHVVAIANSPFSMRSRNGSPLANTFSASFMTNNSFLPEDPGISPRIVGDPIIFPERIVPGGSFFGDPNVPSSLPLFDPTSIRITVQFSEAMDPGRFNPFTTFTLVKPPEFNPPAGDPNNPSCALPPLGAPILGNIEPSPDATSFTFEPLFSLGDRLCTSDPFVLKFSVSPDLTDLAGNSLVDDSGQPLTEPFVFYFTTRDKPGEPNFFVTNETFSTTTNRGSPNDFFHPNTARWTGNGFLEGNPVTRRTVTVADAESTFNLPQPLTSAGNRLQMLYFRDNFNNGSTGPGVESFISMSWGPKSNYVFASIYPLITLKLGHTRSTVSQGLQATFDVNFQGFTNNPTTVYSGPYEVRNQLTQQWQAWPQFAQDFEYSGSSAVVWEANVAPALDPNTSTYQLFRNTSTAPTPGRRIYDVYNNDTAACPPANPPGCAENTFYHQQFVLATKKSFGVSRYYDSAITNPDYTRPLVVFDANRGGACLPNQQIGCFVLTWEGADATSGGQVDANTATGFSTDINIADGHRFIRFEITLNGNPFTGVVPIIDSISFAYQTREGT